MERNQLVEKLNEIEVRYEQVRNQLDEVKLERDNLQKSHTATSQKFQNAIDDMNGQILNLTNEKLQFENTIEQLKTNGRVEILSSNPAQNPVRAPAQNPARNPTQSLTQNHAQN